MRRAPVGSRVGYWEGRGRDVVVVDHFRTTLPGRLVLTFAVRISELTEVI